MKNKKWIIGGALVLVLALSTVSFAIGGFRGFFGDMRPEGMIKEKVLSHLDYTMQELQLTPQQQSQYASIRTRISKSMTDAFKKHEAAREALKAELDRPQPDVKTLATQLKAEVGTMPDRVNSQIDSMLEVYDILTPAQQKQFVQMLKKRMDRKGRHMGPRS